MCVTVRVCLSKCAYVCVCATAANDLKKPIRLTTQLLSTEFATYVNQFELLRGIRK